MIAYEYMKHGAPFGTSEVRNIFPGLAFHCHHNIYFLLMRKTLTLGKFLGGERKVSQTFIAKIFQDIGSYIYAWFLF